MHLRYSFSGGSSEDLAADNNRLMSARSVSNGSSISNNFLNLAWASVNHLRNVLATITDKKIGVSSSGNSLIDHYEADIVSAQDYYPFGMMQPGRKFNADGDSSIVSEKRVEDGPLS